MPVERAFQINEKQLPRLDRLDRERDLAHIAEQSGEAQRGKGRTSSELQHRLVNALPGVAEKPG